MQYTRPSSLHDATKPETSASSGYQRRSGAVDLYKDVGEALPSSYSGTHSEIPSSPPGDTQSAHFPSLATLFRRRSSASSTSSSLSSTSTSTATPHDVISRQSSRQASPSRRISLPLPYLRPAKPAPKPRPVSEFAVISAAEYATVMSSGNAAREERMRRKGRRTSLATEAR
ncbi:hypothetical protein BJY59DRAFT_225792 [Rhodotorula toruloides]